MLTYGKRSFYSARIAYQTVQIAGKCDWHRTIQNYSKSPLFELNFDLNSFEYHSIFKLKHFLIQIVIFDPNLNTFDYLIESI